MRRLSTWLPPLLYMAVIFYLSSLSNPLPQVTQRVSDKILHGLEYGGLAVLLVRAFGRHGASWRAALLAGVVVGSLYGASDEYHQAFVPGRNSAVSDWVADTLGAAAGALVYGRSRAGFARRFTSSVPGA